MKSAEKKNISPVLYESVSLDISCELSPANCQALFSWKIKKKCLTRPVTGPELALLIIYEIS